jgi:molybdopterin converting factor subunit 1
VNVHILFFGATADIAGVRTKDLNLADSATISELLSILANYNNTFSNHKLLVAVNEEYVPANTILKDGDQLAIFTPVSGG